MSFTGEGHLNSDLSNYQPREIDNISKLSEQLKNYADKPEMVMSNFSRFVRMQDITRFLVMHELFKNVLHVHGSIIELGVLNGCNIFSLAHLSEIYEPRNYTRRVFGFDTFEGYVGQTKAHDGEHFYSVEEMMIESETFRELEDAVQLYNQSIQFNQYEKISLIKGDASKTVPEFVTQHPELIVSLLVCHCDIYKPTVDTLEAIIPRMPKGGVIAFGGLNYDVSPGETIALNEIMGLGNFKLERFSFATKAAYLTKE